MLMTSYQPVTVSKIVIWMDPSVSATDHARRWNDSQRWYICSRSSSSITSAALDVARLATAVASGTSSTYHPSTA